MDNIYISIDLNYDTLRIFKSAIKEMNTPKYVRLLIHEDGKSIMLEPYDRKTLTSFKVPKQLYDERSSMRIYSKKLCEIIAHLCGWNSNQTYRVPGKLFKKQGIVLFDLTKAICMTI